MEDPCKTCALREKRNLFLHHNRDQGLVHTHNSPDGSVHLCVDEDIRDIRQLLHTIIESSADCILVWDRQYNYLYANQAAIDHVHTTADRVIGKNIRDGLGHIPHFMRLWMSRIDEVFKSEKPMRVTDAVIIDDKMVYSKSVLSPVRHPGGMIYAVSVVYHDITDQKRLEQELAEKEHTYRELYNHAQIPLYRTRLDDGKMLECNHAMAAMLGYTSKEECLETCYAAAHYVDPNQRIELLEKLKTQSEIRGFQVAFKRLNGAKGWVEITAKLNPEAGYIEGVQYDITAAKVLSQTEKHVLEKMMQGLSNKEIARKLNRSVRTIEGHRQHIMQKLGADNLVELTHIAQGLEFEAE